MNVKISETQRHTKPHSWAKRRAEQPSAAMAKKDLSSAALTLKEEEEGSASVKMPPKDHRYRTTGPGCNDLA